MLSGCFQVKFSWQLGTFASKRPVWLSNEFSFFFSFLPLIASVSIYLVWACKADLQRQTICWQEIMSTATKTTTLMAPWNGQEQWKAVKLKVETLGQNGDSPDVCPYNMKLGEVRWGEFVTTHDSIPASKSGSKTRLKTRVKVCE